MPKKFLLVDDDSDDRELFKEALSSVDASIHCFFAEEAEDALAKLETHEITDPNLIFLDINLPGMSGWQFLATIKANERYKSIPVIMYSTSTHKADKEIASNLGAICFITKPSSFKALRNILNLVIRYSEAADYTALQKTLTELN